MLATVHVGDNIEMFVTDTWKGHQHEKKVTKIYRQQKNTKVTEAKFL